MLERETVEGLLGLTSREFVDRFPGLEMDASGVCRFDGPDPKEEVSFHIEEASFLYEVAEPRMRLERYEDGTPKTIWFVGGNSYSGIAKDGPWASFDREGRMREYADYCIRSASDDVLCAGRWWFDPDGRCSCYDPQDLSDCWEDVWKGERSYEEYLSAHEYPDMPEETPEGRRISELTDYGRGVLRETYGALGYDVQGFIPLGEDPAGRNAVQFDVICDKNGERYVFSARVDAEGRVTQDRGYAEGSGRVMCRNRSDRPGRDSDYSAVLRAAQDVKRALTQAIRRR